jgi:hypothetical protein
MEGTLAKRAKQLLRAFVNDYDPHYGIGSMSCSIYDTAWVAMVSKVVDGTRVWLFPEAFDSILATQLSDGSWPSYACEVDGILNTAASLLALQRHINLPLQLSATPDLVGQATKAASALRRLLQNWNVEATINVGFEVLVPVLLDLLASEGFQFKFATQSKLMAVHNHKMAKFKPEMLYGETQLTIIHSLEALTERIDFNRLSHHKHKGSMMASPSSTAAYLMGLDGWDDDSESYLRHVIAAGQGRGTGLVPSAFPSTYFEASWVSHLPQTFQNLT